MKILEINAIKSYDLPKTEHSKKVFSDIKLQNNSESLIFYAPISFKSRYNIDKSTLIEKGYEEVKIGSDDRVENSSKFLIIDNAEQLTAVSNSPEMEDKYFILTSDIDMEYADFNPIGSYDKPFKGNFDGNGYTIKNLTINYPTTDSGFFSFTEGAKISNLNLDNIIIDAVNEAGGLIGHAVDTQIDNCSVNVRINGDYNIGGMIGVGKSNKINMVKVSGTLSSYNSNSSSLFSDESDKALNSCFGGVIATDEASEINGAYSNITINSDKDSGGIIGVSNDFYWIPTKISGVWFEGSIPKSETNGAILGCGTNVQLSQSVALNNNLIGKDRNCEISNCISKISDIKNANTERWNKSIWDIPQNGIPRIKSVKEKLNPKQVFLEDVNIARELGLFPDSSEEYKPAEFVELPLKIEPPKHYEKNNAILDEIKNCTDKKHLRGLFYKYSDTNSLDCLNTDEYDEILLELVKNKNLDVNYIYSLKDEIRQGFKESIMCHPLYVCSRLGKPYIYREMLKRRDIELDKLCGWDDRTDTFDVMQIYPDDATAYVLYSSQNPKVKEYVSEKVSEYNKQGKEASSKLLNYMNKHYPKVFEYDENKGILKIPKKYFPELKRSGKYSYESNNRAMQSIDDVLRNMDINPNYVDSNGNNIINIAAAEEDELYAFGLFTKAVSRGVSINNRNANGDVPVKTLLETGKNQHILANMLNKLTNPYAQNELGENSIHIFTRNENEKVGISHIEKAISAGLSVNIPDSCGTTPLMNAIEQKYNNMAKFLIQSGADVNICDNNGQSPLHYACINCSGITDLDMIYTLINRNANTKLKDANGLYPIDYLPEEVKAVINLEQNEYTSFRESFKDRPEIYSSIIPNAIQYDAHTQLLENSNLSEEDYNKFIKTNDFNPQILRNIVSNRNTEGVGDDLILMKIKMILSKGELPNEAMYSDMGDTLLHYLMRKTNPLAKECIKLLCQNENVDINARNQLKETPLMAAAETYQLLDGVQEKLSCIDNIFTLLEFSPDINILDDNSQNVLHRICQSDCVILLIKFLELSANINQKDALGKNPIEYLSESALNNMRKCYENYALNKKLKLNIKETLKGLL